VHGLKLKILEFFHHQHEFPIDRVPSCLIFGIWDIGWLGSRPHVQLTMAL
jgi:hypothetical protein